MAWNRQNGAQKVVNAKSSARRWIVCGFTIAAVSLICVVGYFLLRPTVLPSDKEMSSKRNVIKPVKPTIPRSTTKKAKSQEVVERKLLPRETRVKTVSVTTNEALNQLVDKWVDAEGKVHEDYKAFKPPMFETRTDQLIAMAIFSDDRHRIPPMPMRNDKNLDKAFLETLSKPIAIREDDTEEVIQRKTRVMETRDAIKHAMEDEGLSFQEILAEHRRIFNENVEVRNAAIREIKKLRETATPEETKHYVDRINETLRGLGAAEIQ